MNWPKEQNKHNTKYKRVRCIFRCEWIFIVDVLTIITVIVYCTGYSSYSWAKRMHGKRSTNHARYSFSIIIVIPIVSQLRQWLVIQINSNADRNVWHAHEHTERYFTHKSIACRPFYGPQCNNNEFTMAMQCSRFEINEITTNKTKNHFG